MGKGLPRRIPPFVFRTQLWQFSLWFIQPLATFLFITLLGKSVLFFFPCLDGLPNRNYPNSIILCKCSIRPNPSNTTSLLGMSFHLSNHRLPCRPDFRTMTIPD